MSDAPPALLTKEHGPVIITVAMTGNLNTKERNPDLPCTPQELSLIHISEPTRPY